ncbi:MAG: outer membrane protein [Candidatus Pelagibacter sp.]
MKRIIIALLFLSGTITNSFAEVGAKIGITAALGYFETSAKEKEDSETSASRDAEGLGAFGAIFLEKELTDVVSVGVEYTPTAFETEESTHLQTDQKGKSSGAAATQTQKAQVDFTNLMTVYAMARPGNIDGLYLKAGYVQVDVETNETLGTGSTYPNSDMDGFTLGVGIDKDLPNGAFVRAEGSYMQLGGITVTSTNNTANSVTTDDVDGYLVKMSVGKAF